MGDFFQNFRSSGDRFILNDVVESCAALLRNNGVNDLAVPNSAVGSPGLCWASSIVIRFSCKALFGAGRESIIWPIGFVGPVPMFALSEVRMANMGRSSRSDLN